MLQNTEVNQLEPIYSTPSLTKINGFCRMRPTSRGQLTEPAPAPGLRFRGNNVHFCFLAQVLAIRLGSSPK